MFRVHDSTYQVGAVNYLIIVISGEGGGEGEGEGEGREGY